MGQKPPAWAPFDQAGQVPLMLSRDVDESDVEPGSEQNPAVLAEQLVRQNQAAINRFVAVQRQQIEIANKDVHTAMVPLDGMDVYYTHVQGLERMHYHVQPEAKAPTPEAPVPEQPVLPERVRGQPQFINFQLPSGLAVEFFDGVA